MLKIHLIDYVTDQIVLSPIRPKCGELIKVYGVIQCL